MRGRWSEQDAVVPFDERGMSTKSLFNYRLLAFSGRLWGARLRRRRSAQPTRQHAG